VSARPIGEIIAPIMARAGRMAKVQAMLNDVAEPARRKAIIVALYELDGIGADDAQLLIEAYQLETA